MRTYRAHDITMDLPRGQRPAELDEPEPACEPRHDFLLGWFAPLHPAGEDVNVQPLRNHRRRYRTGDLP